MSKPTKIKDSETKTSKIDYPITHAVVCFLIKDGAVFLIEKGRNLGKGKLMGVGGKQEKGETLKETVRREAQEEIRVIIKSIKKVAELEFYFPHHFGNCGFARWGARNAPSRCERPKGKIQICREPP
jgi:8-oxo-dGTP pyrophosphatase MutT (NUDIX family)